MKIKLLFIVLFCLPVLCRAQYSWQALANAPHTYRHDDIFFLNPQKGWAINPNYEHQTPTQFGQVYTTDDGGATWTKIFDSSLTYIRCVGFADSLHGWFGNLADPTATPDTNFLYQTSDGGHTWTPVTNVTGTKPVGICGISVVTDSIIYAYGRVDGPPRFMKTTDQGHSWTSVDMSAYATFLIDAWFFDKDTGVVVGAIDSASKARVLTTFDGGVTWQIRYTDNDTFETCWKVTFPSRNIGYASIESGLNFFLPPPDTTYYLKTTDGGLTWTKNVFTTTYYDEQGIGFINDSIGWLGGDQSIAKTYITTNGGINWAVDTTFGVTVPVYNNATNGFGYSINRFRRFGDTLMYAAGCTVYKYSLNATGIKNIVSAGNDFTVYPNPANNGSNIYIRSGSYSDKLFIEVYDITGKVIDKEHVVAASGNYKLSMKLNKGDYLVKIITKDNNSVIKKVVVN